MTTRPQKWVEEGKRLKLARENARLTQEQVARELDVNRHVVWNWETGRSWPTLGHLRRLTGLYGVTVDWLMGNEDRVAEARPVYSVGQLEELEMASVAIIGAVSAGGLVEAWQEDLGHLEVPRSLAGKPLAGFRSTPGRRIPVLYGMVVYAIRFNNQLLHRQPMLRKRRLGENRGFRPDF
jgi:transcriptional regulator with XRE-family HTH domain